MLVDLARTRETPREQLFDELSRLTAGMLGVSGTAPGLQPMAPHLERETWKIYFFTKRSSQLVASVGMGAQAEFCVVGKDHDYYASLTGPIVQSSDRMAMDRHWSAMSAAWFPGGKDDPDLSLLEFTPNAAAIWASMDSKAVFAWEMTKALVSGAEPDVGVSLRIDI